ncbi:MAG: hypothetical protein P8I55_05625 [Crocinitomix sp.]|nr:hypothetical protein [Crocinitomix sp.]
MMTTKANYFNCFVILILFAGLFTACAPSNRVVNYTHQFKGQSVNGAHARGISANNQYIVISGKDGNLGVHLLDTTMGGAHIQDVIENIEDFRDIHLDEKGNCFLMNSGEKAIIFGIAGGSRRAILFDTAGVFLDGMAFWNRNAGIVFGDPVNGKFYLANMTNGGDDWKTMSPNTMPAALENEAGYAASGTSIQTIGDSTVYFGTGMGAKARLFCSYDRGANWIVKDTPMKAGDSYGIYSMFFWSENEGMICGGSYKDSTYKKGICQYTADGGDTWQEKSRGLDGYISCVQGTANGEFIVATGRMGTFYTTNKGQSWDVLIDRPFYSCFVNDKIVVLTGRNGATEIIHYSISNK